jgi:hypothetical protein
MKPKQITDVNNRRKNPIVVSCLFNHLSERGLFLINEVKVVASHSPDILFDSYDTRGPLNPHPLPEGREAATWSPAFGNLSYLF